MAPVASDQRKVGKIPPGRFKSVYASGRRAVGQRIILFHDEPEAPMAFAAVASRKVGNAVRRNRAKRLMREAFRLHLGRLRCGGAYILVARAGIEGSKSPEVAGELEKLLTRLELLSESMSRNDDAR
ncbi:MAG: ribonuclease P protein component [Candidatus Krumholzibacteriia bacterium]|nr:ribonuclease P protein component [bacterium]MCB9513936.1 ribonuclease P protein component [Candidatus Latescibacterota bacterium]MCB9517063.1 ribonuclease P protein component [Candidatus Latescibacterota bacterium]